MRTVGELLQKSREKKGFSLSDISKLTKIRVSYLGAIEASRYDLLPAPVFTKGFIKSYARLLGLDEEEVLAFYRREFDEQKSKNKPSLTPPQPLHRSIQLFNPTAFIFIFVIVLILGFFSYLYFQYQSYSKAPILSLEKPQDRVEQTLSYTQVLGQASEDAIVKINGQTIKTALNGRFDITVDLTEGENRIEVTAINAIGKETKELRTVYYIREKTASEEPASEINANKIILKIKVGPNAAWVKVILDNEDEENSFEGILNPNTERSFEFQEEVRIRSGNAGSTEVLLNDVSEGFMGEEGVPVEKIYRKE